MSPSRSWGIARCMGWRERQVSQKLYNMLFLEYSYWGEDPPNEWQNLRKCPPPFNLWLDLGMVVSLILFGIRWSSGW